MTFVAYFMADMDKFVPPDFCIYTMAPIGAKIKQCQFETLGLFDKITRLLLYYETSETKKSSSAHAHCAH